MDRFAFLAGLPRTGSTVLGTLLSQHPDLHPTATSVVLDQTKYIQKFSLGESPYYNVKDPSSPVWRIMRGMLYGAYDVVDKKVVIEKDRGWANEVALIRKLTGCEPHILSPVRPIPEIISSFILISQKSGNQSKIENELRLTGRDSNPWTLSRVIWEKYVYSSWRTLKTGYETNPECFLLLDYEDIVSKPGEVVNRVCTYLDVESWAPTTTDLVNPNPENDAVYGLKGLHDVKPVLKKTSPPAWEILGDECYEFWHNRKLEFWEYG